MNRTRILWLSGLAAAGVALAATLATVGGTASPGAAHLASSQVTAAQPNSHPSASPAGPPARPRSRPGNGAPAASSSHASGTLLTDGLYTDAPDGISHYVIALDLSGNDDVSGSVTFLYQDGRTDTIGQYTGKLADGGTLSLTFHGGATLDGTYGAGQLTLTTCSTVLIWAAKIGCRFTYHGHVP
jgi:hypothetical protein